MLNSVSVHGGAWTFRNLGPLTTTFVQPTSCSKEPFVGLGSMSEGIAHWEYGTKCIQTFDSSCFPTTTAPPVTSYDFGQWYDYGSYYSPGLHCPSDWATVGSASPDDDGAPSSSGTGALDDPEYWMPQAMLAHGLEPGQSMALCCPSSMTPDSGKACYSVLKDYKPPTACWSGLHVSHESDSTGYKLSTDATTTETIPYTSEIWNYVTSTRVETDTDVLAELTALSYVPMVTLVWHQSDLKLDSTVTGATDATATATSTSTPNVAGRVGPGASWDGLSVSLGVSSLAMALGAVLVFMA